MNELIEKLAEQAMAKAVAKNFTGEKLELRMPSEAWAKEFAELIVKECVAKCEVVANMATITNNGEMARKTKATADSCAIMIKQHFGVEE